MLLTQAPQLPPSVWIPMAPQVQGVPAQQQAPQGGMSLPNIPTGLSNIGSGITNAVNSWGATNLGIGSVYNAPIGPMAATGAPMNAAAGGISATPLASVLGSAAGGFGVGSLVGGFTGGDPMTSGIGGGLGAGAAALAGFTGPVGLVAGGVLGGLAGGLFGGKKPSDKTQSGGVSIINGNPNRYYADSQSMAGKKYSQQNGQVRDQLENSLSTFTKYLLANGATPVWGEKEDRDVIIQYGSRDGYKWWFEGAKAPNRYGNNYKDFSKSMIEQTLQQYNIPDELKAKLEGMPSDDIIGLANNLGKVNRQANMGKGMTQILLPGRRNDDSGAFKDFLTKYRQNYKGAA